MTKTKKQLLFVAQIAFYVALIWYVSQKWSELTAVINPRLLLERPIPTVLSLICFLGFYGLLSLHWSKLCARYTKFPQQRQWLAFLASQPYKYLPSSAFTFSARAVYAKKLGLPLKQSTAVQLIENLNILGSGIALGALLLAFEYSFNLGILLGGIGMLAIIGVCMVPSLKIPKTAINISGKEWVGLALMAGAGWVLAGAAFYFLASAAGTPAAFVYAVAANSLAMCLGILAVFAPGGIGVREFVYSKFMVTATAIAMWRILTLLIDVVVGLAAILIINRRPDRLKVE